MKFNRNLFVLTSIIPLIISFFLPFIDSNIYTASTQLALIFLFSFAIFSVMFMVPLTLELLQDMYSSKDYVLYIGFNFLMITLAVISVAFHFDDFRPLIFTSIQALLVSPILYLSIKESKKRAKV